MIQEIQTPLLMLHVRTARGNMIINPLEILYLEAQNKRTIIYLNNEVQVETYHLLKWYEEKLSEPQFYRCHNSFMVNCFYVDCTCGNSIILNKKNINIPVSRGKMRYFKDNLEIFKQKEIGLTIFCETPKKDIKPLILSYFSTARVNSYIINYSFCRRPIL